MTCPQTNRTGKRPANEYATSEDFCRVFTEELDDLYQLSLVMTGDHARAEQCFVAGLEHCIKENGVFRDWAHSWAKRVIIQIAIRELKPHPSVASSFSIPVATHMCDFPRGALLRARLCPPSWLHTSANKPSATPSFCATDGLTLNRVLQ